MSSQLTIEEINNLWEYFPATGVIRWKKSVGSRAKAGAIAGTTDFKGYVVITYKGKIYKSHRIAWALVNGAWPEFLIDHKNGVKGDNSIDNLREVDKTGNQQNMRKAQSRNSTGFIGVAKEANCNKFRATIVVGGKPIYLGLYNTPEEAFDVYLDAKRSLHKTCTI